MTDSARVHAHDPHGLHHLHHLRIHAWPSGSALPSRFRSTGREDANPNTKEEEEEEKKEEEDKEVDWLQRSAALSLLKTEREGVG